jgi:hypothetical protein
MVIRRGGSGRSTWPVKWISCGGMTDTDDAEVEMSGAHTAAAPTAAASAQARCS